MSAAHDSLNICNSPWNFPGKVFTAVFCHEAVVFQPEADSPCLVVDTDIHTEDHARCQNFRTFDHIVHIISDMVCAAVPHVCSDIFLAFQDTGVHHLPGIAGPDCRINILHGHSGPDNGKQVI